MFASLALLALVGTYVAAQVDFLRRHHPGIAPGRGTGCRSCADLAARAGARAAVLAVVAFVLERYARRQ